MVEFTLFEVHLDDASFTANAPLSGSGDEAGTGETDDAAEEAGAAGPGKLLALFATLVILGIVMWVIRNGADDESGGDEA